MFLVDRLELLGFGVTLIDDDVVTAGDASGKDLVIVSHTVSSGDILGMFRDVAVPVITWEDGIFDDMGLSTSSRGDVDNVTDLGIVTDHRFPQVSAATSRCTRPRIGSPGAPPAAAPSPWPRYPAIPTRP